MSLADLGGYCVTGRVGATLQSTNYAEMDRIDAGATSLNGSMTANMTDPVTRQGWYAWLGRWNDYHAKKSSPFWKYSILSLAASDQWRDEINGWAHDLDRWYATYESFRSPSGQPLPTVPGGGAPDPIPVAPSDPNHPKPWFGVELPSVPWWGWVLITMGCGAVAYSIYEAAQAGRENTRALVGGFGSYLGSRASMADQTPPAAGPPA